MTGIEALVFIVVNVVFVGFVVFVFERFVFTPTLTGSQFGTFVRSGDLFKMRKNTRVSITSFTPFSVRINGEVFPSEEKDHQPGYSLERDLIHDDVLEIMSVATPLDVGVMSEQQMWYWPIWQRVVRWVFLIITSLIGVSLALYGAQFL